MLDWKLAEDERLTLGTQHLNSGYNTRLIQSFFSKPWKAEPIADSKSLDCEYKAPWKAACKAGNSGQNWSFEGNITSQLCKSLFSELGNTWGVTFWLREQAEIYISRVGGRIGVVSWVSSERPQCSWGRTEQAGGMQSGCSCAWSCLYLCFVCLSEFWWHCKSVINI